MIPASRVEDAKGQQQSEDCRPMRPRSARPDAPNSPVNETAMVVSAAPTAQKK